MKKIRAKIKLLFKWKDEKTWRNKSTKMVLKLRNINIIMIPFIFQKYKQNDKQSLMEYS